MSTTSKRRGKPFRLYQFRDAMVSAARCFTRWVLVHVFILVHVVCGRREGALLVPRTRTFYMCDKVVFGTYNQNAKK